MIDREIIDKIEKTYQDEYLKALEESDKIILSEKMKLSIVGKYTKTQKAELLKKTVFAVILIIGVIICAFIVNNIQSNKKKENQPINNISAEHSFWAWFTVSSLNENGFVVNYLIADNAEESMKNDFLENNVFYNVDLTDYRITHTGLYNQESVFEPGDKILVSFFYNISIKEEKIISLVGEIYDEEEAPYIMNSKYRFFEPDGFILSVDEISCIEKRFFTDDGEQTKAIKLNKEEIMSFAEIFNNLQLGIRTERKKEEAAADRCLYTIKFKGYENDELFTEMDMVPGKEWQINGRSYPVHNYDTMKNKIQNLQDCYMK
ncbi:MAG: hypothetical protein J6M24_06670 [Lachnospiraceae bacterium]|nr:hypothetical protein [Lachnospiraceae bacterium]